MIYALVCGCMWQYICSVEWGRFNLSKLFVTDLYILSPNYVMVEIFESLD